MFAGKSCGYIDTDMPKRLGTLSLKKCKCFEKSANAFFT